MAVTKVCKKSGCGRTAIPGKDYCQKHIALQDSQEKRRVFTRRSNSNQWHYLYESARWRRESKEFLKRFYYNDILKSMDILPYVINVADVNSYVNSRLVAMGRKPSLPDSMIAATAIANNLTLVTRNVKDFQQIADIMPLKIENWFWEYLSYPAIASGFVLH